MTRADRADVVVVGGGILGAAAALHLRRAGVEDVLLIDRDAVAQGTSRAGAGFIGMWGAGYVAAWDHDEELDIEQYGLEFYADLAERGFEFGYRRNGTLWVATTPEAWVTHLSPIAEHPRVADRRELLPEEIEALTEIVDATGVHRGIIHPGGGYVDAPLAAEAVVERLRECGGRVETRRPAERIVVSADRVTGVDTAIGRIAADAVVVACGAWSNQLLAGLEVWLPMTPLVATRIVTEPLGLPSTMPTITVPEHASLWLRETSGALLWGIDYSTAPHHAFVDAPPPERFDMLPLDGMFATQAVGTRATTAIPILGRFESVTVAHGAPTFTADQRGLVGAIGGIDGLYVMAGCNEGGISHAPGWGRLIASLIVDGAGSVPHAPAFSPDRFAGQFTSGRQIVEAMGGGWGERAPAAA